MMDVARVAITSGDDDPGMNAAIRAVGRFGIDAAGWRVFGFQQGCAGLIADNGVPLGVRKLLLSPRSRLIPKFRRLSYVRIHCLRSKF